MGFLHTFHIWNHVGFLDILDFGEFQYLIFTFVSTNEASQLVEAVKSTGCATGEEKVRRE